MLLSRKFFSNVSPQLILSKIQPKFLFSKSISKISPLAQNYSLQYSPLLCHYCKSCFGTASATAITSPTNPISTTASMPT